METTDTSKRLPGVFFFQDAFFISPLTTGQLIFSYQEGRKVSISKAKVVCDNIKPNGE
jgi:hypothetical protein